MGEIYSRVWLRSSRAVRASECQCYSRNNPGFDPGILGHSGVFKAADEAVLSKVHKKFKNPLIQQIFHTSSQITFQLRFTAMYKHAVPIAMRHWELPKPTCIILLSYIYIWPTPASKSTNTTAFNGLPPPPPHPTPQAEGKIKSNYPWNASQYSKLGRQRAVI